MTDGAPLSTRRGAFRTWIREPTLTFIFATVLADELPSPAQLTVEDVVARDGTIELELELLDLEISGVVRSQFGNPVSGALVTALEGTTTRLSDRSGKDGSFAIRTYHAGEYRVRASREGLGNSREEVFVLGETLPAASADLVLRPSRQLEGRVIGPSGEAISGAGIVAMSADEVWVSDNAVTDLEGRFSVEAAAGSGQAIVTVTAGGYPFWSACIDSSAEALIQLPPAGGWLEVHYIESEDPSLGAERPDGPGQRSRGSRNATLRLRLDQSSRARLGRFPSPGPQYGPRGAGQPSGRPRRSATPCGEPAKEPWPRDRTGPR